MNRENTGAAAGPGEPAGETTFTTIRDVPDDALFDIAPAPAAEEAAKPAAKEEAAAEEAKDDDKETKAGGEDDGGEDDKEGEGGDEETPDGEDGEGEGEGKPETMWTVKVDGKEMEVAESELVKGYMLQADYTRKTQGHAETVRKFEAQRDKDLGALQQALAYYALPQAKKPDPREYVGKEQDFVRDLAAFEEAEAKEQKAAQVLEAITADETDRTHRREAALLLEKIPEWKDDTARKADMAKIIPFARDRYGVTEEEIQSVQDHRLFLILRDAARAADLDAKPVVLSRKTKAKPEMGVKAKSTTREAGSTKSAALKNAQAKLKSGEKLTEQEESLLLFEG